MLSKGKLKKDFHKNKYKYIMVIPVLIYLFLFCYKPMYGVIIAFQRYRPTLGIARSPWVGLDNFVRFFKDVNFWRVVRNTFTISFLSILFTFPAPILLALLLNEVRVSWFKRLVQTVTYLPHFIAMVVVCGLVNRFCQSDGLINDLIAFFGGERSNLLIKTNMFYPIYILSDIWKEVGWNSIIYLATLASIDQEQYEAARIDGAGRIQQMWYITLPGLLPTISMLLILRLGNILGVGQEKILLLYNEMTYEVADVISTFVYRKGLSDADYSYSTAIGLFDSIINIVFLVGANKISKKLGQSGLF
ncbi:MAG: sugar ABC transporter permease [Lachnospiraceae bacterium]|nr:sugar ABC transporter permease [Lachnospiraceae bacterium]MBQ8232309.1 sugar ABC transporter permease [Lachnospiraceae bacterium]